MVDLALGMVSVISSRSTSLIKLLLNNYDRVYF